MRYAVYIILAIEYMQLIKCLLFSLLVQQMISYCMHSYRQQRTQFLCMGVRVAY